MLWRDDIETIMVAGGRGFIYIYIYRNKVGSTRIIIILFQAE